MQETEGRACVERPTGRTEPVGMGRGPGWPGSMVERSQAAHSRGNLGSLQLEVRLRDETVLPSGCYQPLVQLLCREVKLGTQVRGPLGEGGRVQGQHVCPPCPSKPTLKSKTLRCQGGEEAASAQAPPSLGKAPRTPSTPMVLCGVKGWGSLVHPAALLLLVPSCRAQGS